VLSKWTLSCGFAALTLLGSPGVAAGQQAQPAAATANGGQTPPPSALPKRICERITVTGSRLGGHKFCGTAEEWAERRKYDREAIEKVQASPCVPQSTGPSGRPTC